MFVNGISVYGFLRETGVPIRTNALLGQQSPKEKYAVISLSGRTLYDLIPGKIYAINVITKEDFRIYNNQRELWYDLNPNDVVKNMDSLTSKSYIQNRVGRFFNLDKCNSTEIGNFYFCRHPDYLTGNAKVAKPIYVCDIFTGYCTYYCNISQISSTNRTGIRMHIANKSIHKQTLRYIYASEFWKHFPENVENKQVTLTKEQLKKLLNGSVLNLFFII